MLKNKGTKIFIGLFCRCGEDFFAVLQLALLLFLLRDALGNLPWYYALHYRHLGDILHRKRDM